MISSISIGAMQRLRPSILGSNRAPIVSLQTRFLSSADNEKQGSSKIKAQSAGLPEYMEHWNRNVFRYVGYSLAAVSVAAVPSGEYFLATVLSTTTAGYWYIGLRDIKQTGQTIRRNFPVLGNMRYILESIRPEIRQYFIEDDDHAVPFTRMHRAMAYKRAKGDVSSMPFGTKRDTHATGYEWVNHSLYPTKLGEQRVMIGANNPLVKQPYSSSLLNISAMSYGALSDRAVLALSAGAKLGGFSHNTGEGGVSRFHKEGGADLVWNMGTAYFGCGKFGKDGVREFDADLFKENAQYVKMIEIKLSQGAKPAHGGTLIVYFSATHALLKFLEIFDYKRLL